MEKLTNAIKVVRSRRFDKGHIYIYKTLKKLDDLRRFFHENEINNPLIWEKINEVEKALVGDKFDSH